MKFRIDGRELEAVEHPRIREACEAEKALGMDLEDGFTARIAVSIFVALRREEPQKAAGLIADYVLDMDLSSLEGAEEEELPPAEAPDEGAQESQLTTGALRSVNSA